MRKFRYLDIQLSRRRARARRRYPLRRLKSQLINNRWAHVRGGDRWPVHIPLALDSGAALCEQVPGGSAAVMAAVRANLIAEIKDHTSPSGLIFHTVKLPGGQVDAIVAPLCRFGRFLRFTVDLGVSWRLSDLATDA